MSNFHHTFDKSHYAQRLPPLPGTTQPRIKLVSMHPLAPCVETIAHFEGMETVWGMKRCSEVEFNEALATVLSRLSTSEPIPA